MSYAFKNGQGSVILRVNLFDSSSSTGAGLPGLTSASAGLIISTIADSEAVTTNYTQSGALIDGITTLGTYAAPTATHCRFKEVDAANQPGLYEIQLADARYAVSGAKSLIVGWLGAANLAQGKVVIPLQNLDPYDVLSIFTKQMTESYNADGSAPTAAQALFGLMSKLFERSISGTTETTKKLDGSTTAMTFTLNDATNPTAVTRAS